MVTESKLFCEFIYCHCNCGFTRTRYDELGREMKYIAGHQNKGKTRERHNKWKGGFYYETKGYKRILMPEHHDANNIGYVLEHRLVYEEFYKCSLLKWTDVHHVNGIKDDNRIENLEAMIHNRHSKTTHKKDMKNRYCAICNNKSLIIKNTITTWSKNPIGEGYICKRCMDNLLYGLKKVGW